jgi:hypothetical protein
MLLFQSCIQKSLGPSDYIHWLQDEKNGLIKTVYQDKIEYKLQYKTREYVALLDQSPKTFNSTTFSNDTSEMAGYAYFTLYLSDSLKKIDLLKYGETNPGIYSARINYFSNYMQNDISMRCNGDEYPCKIFLYERDYNISPFQKFILAFPKAGDFQNFEIVFNDQVFSGKEITFNFTKTEISKIPKLTVEL